MNNYDNLINTVLDGRYRLMAIIGTGGMAVVFEAYDLQMGRRVAVKMLKDEIKEDERELKRFINESRATAMMSHPNIVQVFDVSVKIDGEHQYIVMELIDGITLKDYISKKGRLKWQEAIGYMEQILHALAHAHEKGIIHRDVKPQNIMLLRSGRLKITDFGIAKIPNSEQLTITDKAIGTVHYISPEQVDGKGKISPVSDIYSVGIILYEIMTGKLPFDGENAFQIAKKQVDEAPQDPRAINPEIPRGLSQIILKAMSKPANDRYQTAGEMIRQLDVIKSNPAAVFNYANAKGAVVAVRPTAEAEENNRAVRQRNNQANQSIVRQEDIDEEEPDDNERRKKGRNSKKVVRRRSSRSMLPIISGVTLAFLIVAGVSIFNIIWVVFGDPTMPEDNNVVIPDFRGQNINDVDFGERLTVGDITFENNDNFEENYIISHFPAPGDDRRWTGQGIRVNFRVSKGRDLYIVEDLGVLEFRNVALDLESRGINVIRVPQSDDFVPSNHIISTDPGPGAVLGPGDTITIYVSSGQEIRRVLMPNVEGLSEREARRVLAGEQIAISAIISEHSDTVAPGFIIAQSIPRMTSVPRRSTRVTLTVSIGPEHTDDDGEGG